MCLAILLLISEHSYTFHISNHLSFSPKSISDDNFCSLNKKCNLGELSYTKKEIGARDEVKIGSGELQALGPAWLYLFKNLWVHYSLKGELNKSCVMDHLPDIVDIRPKS